MNGYSLMKAGGDHRLAYDSDEGGWRGSSGGQSIVRIKMYREDQGREGDSEMGEEEVVLGFDLPRCDDIFSPSKKSAFPALSYPTRFPTSPRPASDALAGSLELQNANHQPS